MHELAQNRIDQDRRGRRKCHCQEAPDRRSELEKSIKKDRLQDTFGNRESNSGLPGMVAQSPT
jgi:hypothetical protein